MIPGNGSLWDNIKFVLSIPAALVVGAFRMIVDAISGRNRHNRGSQ